jgi:DNA repair protein RadD
MITLRKNQTEPIRKATEFFRKEDPKPSLIVLPTAWGKSILTAFVAKSMKDKLLVLQPSKELLEQNFKKYLSLCGDDLIINAGIYSASFERKDINKITYATIGSIKNIGKLFKRLGFTKMLIDEAHMYPREAESMLGTFIAESGITHVLGITATPIKLQQNTDMYGNRFSKLQMLTSQSKKGNFFKDIIHVGQVGEMVELGFWSKLEYKTTGFDGSLLVYNSSKSEYTEESVERAFKFNNIHEQIKQQLSNNSNRKHILVFVPSVAEAKQLSKQYPDSAAIYGDMHKDERAKVIDEFRNGKTRVIFNVRVLSTGFDFTGIDCIIFGISTASIALYYQIVGRGTRIDTAKKDCLIIDLAGNVERFGRVEDIVFEKEGLWRMYGTGGKLLSGIPIHEIGTVTRQSIATNKVKTHTGKTGSATGIVAAVKIMPFGKYKGIPVRDVPDDYKRWMLEKIEWNNANANLKQAILQSI